MDVHQGLEGLEGSRFRRPAVTIGVFDGLHRGHQKVLEHLREMAARLEGQSVVLTFDHHPMAVIRGAAPRRILSNEHRLLLLERLGIDHAIVVHFDDQVRRTSYETFTREVLVQRLGIRGLLFGYNSNFGRGGEGGVGQLQPLGERFGFLVEEAAAFLLDGKPISSTRIREAIAAGDLDAAQTMLGRPVSLLGTVVRGDGRGRTLGFPTANLDVHDELLPPPAVYEVRVRMGPTERRGVANLGHRPTWKESAATPPLLEVHLPGFEGDLYGEALEVEFVRKIRDERRFESIDALLTQIRRDVASIA